MSGPVHVKDESLTVPEAARRLGIGVGTAWRWIASGRLAAFHHGSPRHGSTRVPVEALAAAGKPSARGLRSASRAVGKAVRRLADAARVTVARQRRATTAG